MENGIKGILILAVWGLAAIGIAAVLPDSAWEECPKKLYPVREFLAGKHIISSEFQKSIELDESATSVAVDGSPSGSSISSDSSSDVSRSEAIYPDASNPETSCSDDSVCSIPDFNDYPRVQIGRNPNETPSNGSPETSATRFDSEPENRSFFAFDEPDNVSTLKKSETTIGQSVGTGANKDESTALSDSPSLAASTSPTERSIDSNIASNAAVAEINIPSDGSSPNASILPVSGTIESHSDIPAFPQIGAIASAAETIDDAVSQTNGSATEANPLNSSASLSPSEQLREAIETSRRPDQTTSAFFKLNKIREEFDSTLSDADRSLLNETLDRLAFAVFYDSRQYLLEPRYVVGPNETLTSIAEKYKITPEHLAVLNATTIPVNEPIAPGTGLKVVRGPVSAEVSLRKNELLLQFDGLYAGRFKMGCARNALGQRGELTITRKIANPQYNGPLNDGQWGQIAGGDANNPLGPFWLELNNGLGLQGTNRPELIGSQSANQGGLIFSNRDVSHLNILLPVGAKINIVD